MRIKCLTAPGLGFGSFQTARRSLAGDEAMVRKKQVRKVGGRDMKAQNNESPKMDYVNA